MHVLVVPMNPEFFPEAAMLLAGLFAGTMAVRSLSARQRLRAVGLGALAIALISTAIVLGRGPRVHSPYGKPHAAQARRPAGPR
jgi:hypothetical protein